jgi:hypothetical protein
VRYLVRDREGRELTVPSLADLRALHRHGFLAEEDLVRRETAERWERAGELLGAPGPRRRGGQRRWLWTSLLGALILAAGLAVVLWRR